MLVSQTSTANFLKFLTGLAVAFSGVDTVVALAFPFALRVKVFAQVYTILLDQLFPITRPFAVFPSLG